MPKLSPVHWRRFEAVVLACGCTFAGQEGSHRKYEREGLPRPVIIPTYDELPVFIIQGNLRTLGLSRADYFRLLASA